LIVIWSLDVFVPCSDHSVLWVDVIIISIIIIIVRVIIFIAEMMLTFLKCDCM